MKKSHLFLILSTFAATALLFIGLLPYHFYARILREGVSHRLLKILPPSKAILKGVDYNTLEKQKKLLPLKRWELLHFSHFILPFPKEESSYQMGPYIVIEKNKKTHLGITIRDRFVREYFSFIEKGKRPFNLTMLGQKLFQLPIFKKKIEKISEENIWDDLFSKDLTIFNKKSGAPTFIQFLNNLKNISYNELVYNLYLLKLRERVFPENLMKIFYDYKRKMKIIRLSSVDERFMNEIIYHKSDGDSDYYILKMRWLKWKKEAAQIKELFYSYLKEKKSNETSSIPLYNKFLDLDYRKKIGQPGLIYYYTSWAHHIEDKEYFSKMMRHLEKGPENKEALIYLYEYAYQKYGKDYKSHKEINEEKKIELEKIEHRKLLKKIIKSPIDLKQRERKSALKALKRAKEEQKTSDKREGVLLID